MPKKDKIWLIISYIELFMESDIKTWKFLYHDQEITDITYSTSDSIFWNSISVKNKLWETRRISINDLIKSKEFNFKELFIKNYKYYYEKDDIWYNKIIDEIIDEIQNK